MVKTSTVIKRMVSAGWKPAVIIVSMVTAASLGSDWLASTYDLNRDVVYWSMIGLWFLFCMIKWSYETTRAIIQNEQNQLLRDIRGKN